MYIQLIEVTLYDEAEDKETDCLIGVTHCINKRPDNSCKDSDVDFYGYREVEYDILDKEGNPLPEWEKKLSKANREYIEDKIFDEMEEE
jgi:hypothetical protein